VIENAEAAVHALGFRVCRVRHHDLGGAPGPVSSLARLEIGVDELPRALEPETRDRLVRDIRAAGYQHVTIDLQGYRMGSLNEGVRLEPI
jgi:uncharacterized protein